MGHGPGKFARDKCLATPRRFMVEQDPAGSVHAIAFAVVDRYAMGKDFGTAIGTTRVEPGILVLRGRYASEHLAGRGLIKPAPDSRSLDGLKQSNGTQRNHVRGVFGNFEAHFDVALRAQVVPVSLYTSDAADDLLCVDLGGRR